MKQFDFVVIGAGIAGVSAAAGLAQHGTTLVLEREPRPAYHSTGRSAAFFAPGYGNRVVRELTTRSAELFRAPPDGFSAVPLLRKRPWIWVARPDQLDALDTMAADLGMTSARRSAGETENLVPILRPGYAAASLYDDRGGDLDVDAVFNGFLREMRRGGGQLVCDAEVEALRRADGAWKIHTSKGEFSTSVVVNAAGAWADVIARSAGLEPIGLQSKRRTVILIPAPDGPTIADWPLVIDADEQFYFKPDAGQILASPADETDTPPCDAQPEELDVAMAVHHLEQATVLDIRRVNHRWAGLRVFASDRSPVVGFDPRTEGFFWLAGQGGYGVQTSPALGELTATLLARNSSIAHCLSSDLLAELSPARLLAERSA